MQNGKLTPGHLMEISGGYWKTCALHAAVKLDVFTVIGDAEIAGDAVARETGTDARAMTMLLNALVAMGILQKTEDHFANTEIAGGFLSKDSPKYLGRGACWRCVPSRSHGCRHRGLHSRVSRLALPGGGTRRVARGAVHLQSFHRDRRTAAVCRRSALPRLFERS